MRASLTSLLALVLPSALLIGACHSVPPRYGDSVRPLASQGLQEANPNDVVVMPVVYEAMASAPDELLREAFHGQLPIKRYAPVSLDYTDSRAVAASYMPGACDEDAVLEIVIHRWDSDLWKLRSALDVDIEVRILDAAGQQGLPLWAARLDQRFDFGGKGQTFASERQRMRFACDAIARELLADLPARRAEPTPIGTQPAGTIPAGAPTQGS